MDIEKIIKEMTVDEKAVVVSGIDNAFTNAIDRLGVESIRFADGPHGVRKQIDSSEENMSESVPATCFPTAVTTSSSFNPANLYAMGQAIGEECKHHDIKLLLGPGINIKRNPFCGRNFEYFSEDPYLAGELASSFVDGVQNQGVGVALKHFALNSLEKYRFMGNSVCDERAIREIYLKAFEKVVKKSKPASIMCAYNKVNGEYCSENQWLLTDVLRKEWGYEGVVMSDWGAVNDRVKGIKAGLDLEMPGNTAYCRRKIVDGVKKGLLLESELDECVRRVLKLVDKYKDNQTIPADLSEHNDLAGKIAEDSAVLMQNDGILPLNEGEKICVIGDMFDKMRYQGAGSSQINPTSVTSPKDAFDKAGVRYVWERGYDCQKTEPDYELIDQAVESSATFDKVVLFIGLTSSEESEGGDREKMSLAENQLALLDALSDTGVKIAVVLFGGSVSETSYSDRVSAILNMFLPGQNGGTAVYNLLFGHANPSGRLSESWIESYDQVPFGEKYGSDLVEPYYESVYVGYRYYLSAKKRVKYPFGYGLSYTEFKYSDMSVENYDDYVVASCTVQNVGRRFGGEVVQLYAQTPETKVFKPLRELKGFEKVYLESGESQRVDIKIDKKDLRYYNIHQNRWVLENGEYALSFCSDSASVLLTERYYETGGEEVSNPYTQRVSDVYKNLDFDKVDDEIFEEMSGQKLTRIKIKPFTVDSRICDFKSGVIGKIIYKAIMSVPEKMKEEALALPEGKQRSEMLRLAEFNKKNLENNCLRAMSMCDKRLPYNLAECIVALSNWRFIKAIGKLLRPYRVKKIK